MKNSSMSALKSSGLSSRAATSRTSGWKGNIPSACARPAPGDGGIDLLHLIRTAERCDPDMPFIIEHLDSDEAYLQSIAHVRKLLEGGG